ncbi:hypothetical protein NF212_16100 [Parasalinivibrio latis]|uniref:hypothetical protein n=1 Tax=Parasalinivibrio latis TaxID=2952610 RepID=UPI0030DFA792
MTKITVLLAVEIDNQNDWLGLDDYKADIGENATDLDVFNLMAEEENGNALVALINLVDASNPSRFVGVYANASLPELHKVSIGAEILRTPSEISIDLDNIAKRIQFTKERGLAERAKQLAQDSEDLERRINHSNAATINREGKA